jgi:polysaccharide biosynthesis protein PelA
MSLALRFSQYSKRTAPPILSALAVISVMQIATVSAVNAPRLCVNYSSKPDPQELAAFNLSILDPAAEIDLAQGHRAGNKFLAYVATVEMRPDAPHAEQAKSRGVKMLGKNEGWGSDVMDVTGSDWEDFVVKDLAEPAIAKGYDGVFLDTLDSIAFITKKDPGKKYACQRALVNLIRRLHRQFPDKQIVLNRGFDLLDEVRKDVNGVLAESLYQRWNRSLPDGGAAKPEDTAWLLDKLNKAKAMGLMVYVVDYVSPEDRELARVTAEKIAAHGFIPFISTPELRGELLAPLREMPRRVLVVHGWNQGPNDRPPFEIDTLTAGFLQTPLEYFGMEVDFLNVAKKQLPERLADRYRGIILDQELRIPVEKEEAFATWLLDQRKQGVKLLFTGELPFHREHVWNRVVQELGMDGEHRHIRLNGKPAIAQKDAELMAGEVPIEALRSEFHALAAPRGARVALSLTGEDIEGHSLRFDPIFLTDWGGAMFRPYILLSGMPGQVFSYCDLYRFTSEWLGTTNPMPIPDTSTRDGMRIFYTHIDGDGFVSQSSLAGRPICGEAIRDRILKKYPFPVTVSVIEAEIEAQIVGLDQANIGRYREAARSTFALPNVQAGSHSWSHPFRWLDYDPADDTKYATRGLVLKPSVALEGVDMEREVKGSIKYINETLLPPGKQVEIMLWSGNCRPGHEALRHCSELGVENMNGGNTVLSRLYPGIASVSPRHTRWDDEMQVFSSNQNEFLYANGWQGPFYGGFANLIDTLERTGSPRRLKPVNVYYHFYSATHMSSLRALEKIMDWCQSQPLHALTARDYARIVKDAYRTRIYPLGPRRWLVSNEGQLRTLRFAASAGTPDMALCKGVTGYVVEGDLLYVHTSGLPVTEIVLADKPAAALHLVQSTAEIDFTTLTANLAEFSAKDVRSVQATFAGLPPQTSCRIVVNGQKLNLKTNAQGQLPLNLPASATVTLQSPLSSYAAQN